MCRVDQHWELAMRTLRFAIDRWLIGGVVAALVLITVAIIVFANSNVERRISLSSIITTSPQGEMRSLSDVFPSGEMESFKTKILSFHGNAATAFLVDAATEKDAINASAGVLFGSMPADKAVPVNTADPKRGSQWLVAHLGLGPSYPTCFVIEETSVKADKIRLTYWKAKAADATADIHHYYYWVPLGKLKAGTYHVELYDADLNEETLSRRVEVEQEKRP